MQTEDDMFGNVESAFSSLSLNDSNDFSALLSQPEENAPPSNHTTSTDTRPITTPPPKRISPKIAPIATDDEDLFPDANPTRFVAIIAPQKQFAPSTPPKPTPIVSAQPSMQQQHNLSRMSSVIQEEDGDMFSSNGPSNNPFFVQSPAPQPARKQPIVEQTFPVQTAPIRTPDMPPQKEPIVPRQPTPLNISATPMQTHPRTSAPPTPTDKSHQMNGFQPTVPSMFTPQPVVLTPTTPTFTHPQHQRQNSNQFLSSMTSVPQPQVTTGTPHQFSPLMPTTNVPQTQPPVNQHIAQPPIFSNVQQPEVHFMGRNAAQVQQPTSMPSMQPPISHVSAFQPTTMHPHVTFQHPHNQQQPPLQSVPSYQQPMTQPIYPSTFPQYPIDAHYQQDRFNSFKNMNAAQRENVLHNMDNQDAKPIVSFGFGGRIVVMFPQRAQKLNVLDSTLDYKLPYNRNGPVLIHDLQSVLAQTPYLTSLQQFPGPLTSNTNKQELLNFIENQINQVQLYQSELISANPRLMASKQLWQLLKVIVQYEALTDQNAPTILQVIKGILLEHKKEVSSFANESTSSRASIETQQDIAHLEKLLIDGNIEEATQYAIQTKLWTHAILLSVMIDKTTYQKVVTAFTQSSFPEGSTLRTLYMMFADRADLLFQQATSFSTDQFGTLIAQQTRQQQNQVNKLCENWEENLAVILANRTASSGKVIEKLGDMLSKEYGLVECGHFCYLVADFLGLSDMSSRVSLLGGDHKRDKMHYINASTIQRSEIYDFCKQRKQGNMLGSSPHMLSYKLVYAYWLAEVGMLAQANQYLEAMWQVVERTRQTYAHSPYFMYHAQVLRHRITEYMKLNQISTASSFTSAAKSRASGVASWLFSKLDSGLNRIIHGSAEDEDSLQSTPSPTVTMPTQPKRAEIPQEQVVTPAPKPVEPSKPAPTPSTPESTPASKSSFWGWFSFSSSNKRTANIGSENALVWSDKAKRWIPKNANPDDYVEEEQPPPPDVSAISTTSPAFDMNARRVSTSGVGARYVDVGFGKPASSPPPQQPTPMMDNALLFNNFGNQQPSSNFFIPQQQPMNHVEHDSHSTTEQVDLPPQPLQQQQYQPQPYHQQPPMMQQHPPMPYQAQHVQTPMFMPSMTPPAHGMSTNLMYK